MQYKSSKKLFHGKYQYKIVLILSGAVMFRGTDYDQIAQRLSRSKVGDFWLSRKQWAIRTDDDMAYALALQNTLAHTVGTELRVESPWISVYTNSVKDLDNLYELNPSKVKYICKPPIDNLPQDTIILPRINFDYKVTLGSTDQEYSAFVNWACSNAKVKMTKSCKADLSKGRSRGGSYFYITGDNNLLLAKMQLSGVISKVEHVIHSTEINAD